MIKTTAFCLSFLLILASTASCAPVPSPAPIPGDTVTMGGLVLPTGYEARIAVEGLDGPTQMIKGPDGDLWVAQLAGREDEGVGEVVAIDLHNGERRILVDGLLKPTGIAALGGYLWIATKRDLLRVPLDEEGGAGSPEAVFRDLPFNGRSNGTLTVSPHGDLIYETSGARFGGAPIAGSAALWRLRAANPTEPVQLATGLKNAYAHAFDDNGRLWTSEIADDPVNGQVPPDELNLVVAGADFGWPKCFADQQPALNYGGTAAYCLRTQGPVMTFAPRSTPTSLAFSPWEPDTLLVAFWMQGIVARLHLAGAGEGGGGTQETFIEGMQNPQHILVWDDNTVLVSDHSVGKIYEIRRTNARRDD